MSDSVSEHDDSGTLPCPVVGNPIDHPNFGRGRIKEVRRGGTQLLVHFLKDDCHRWVLFSEMGISPSPSAANQPSAVADPDPTSTKIGTIIDHPLLGRGEVLQTRLDSSELLVRFIEDGTTRWIQPASKRSSEPSNTTDSIDPRQSNTNLAKSAQPLLHPSTARAAHDSLFLHTENKDVGRTNTPQVADAPSADQVNGSEEDLAREKHTDLGATGSANQYAARLPLGQADRVSMAIEFLLASRSSPMSAHEIADDLILEFITMKEILSALRNTEKFFMFNNGCFDLAARHTRKLDTEGNDSAHPVPISETGPNPELPELMSLQSLRVLPVPSTSHKMPSNELLPGSVEGKNQSIWAQDSSELSAHPSESPELLKENSDDGQECEEGIAIGDASSVQEKEISKDENPNEEDIDQSDPSFAELGNHFWLSTRAKKVLRENVASIQELLELDRKKLATFPDCGSKSMDEIMELVRNIDPKPVSNVGGIQTSHKGGFDDRMITLSATPPCEETLDLLPIFSSEKIEYFSEDELHPGYKASASIAALPFSTRVKRYLNAMGFTTLGKLLLSVDSDLLEYRYFQRSDLREVRKVVRDFLLCLTAPSSIHFRQSSTLSRSISSHDKPTSDISSTSPIAKNQTRDLEPIHPVAHRQSNASHPPVPWPGPVSGRQAEHLPESSSQKAKMTTVAERCGECEKLVMILQEMLIRNERRVFLFIFMERVKDVCKEHCVPKGFPLPTLDRGFISRLLARNHNLYVIKDNCVTSRKSLRSSTHPKAQSKGVESAIEFEHASNSAIDPEDVIAWLVTQPNANGTLYLENVVRQYMGALRAAPAKLQIPVVSDVRSVFTCRTPDELNAYWDIFKAAPNYKQVNSSTSGMFSAGMGCLLRYLDYLSSTEDTVEDMFFCQAPTPQSGIDVWNENIKQAFQTWLIKVVNYSPKTAQIYASAVARAVRSYRQIAETASSRSDTHAEAVQRFIALLAGDSDFVEANKSGHNQLSAALSAFQRFIASESTDTISEETKIITSRKAKPHEPVNAGIDPLLLERLTDVLSSRFANGYRLNSPIEMARFRTFAVEDLGEELTLTDEELKSYIAACGTTFDRKVYAVSSPTKERIKELAEDYFADGAQAIFFAEFYAKNEKWLFEARVVSEDMLIDILRRLFPKLSFTQTYFGYTDASIFGALEGEILRVWGDDVLLTYGQLAERLRYIPLERIKSLLGQNGDFIWSSIETFSHVSRIEITDEEQQVIREAAERECNARGYASITDLPFGEIEERHYELSITAVHNTVYRICLSDKFDKKGKIVARKGDVFDALIIMKEYCRTIDKCSLDDLLTYGQEITGEVHPWIPMEAGNTVLVRIDKNTYVADRYVHFNADMIDEAIGLFVKGDYLPLKSFTTFGAFPDCGQTWNLFLLESYCRRFSRKFRFDTLTVNSRNAGAVIRNSRGMDYTEIMIDAVANADLPLKDTTVGKFLYESGYTGRSTTAKVNEIIDKAKAIREMKD